MALFSKPTARALAILDLLMANPQKSFGLTEMTRRLKLNKATCHAILTTMGHYGFLVQHPSTKAYRLGPSIIAAGNSANAQFPVLEFARPEMEILTAELGMGCGAMGRTSHHVVLLAHYGAAASFESPFQQGLRLPNIAPLGACFMAWSPPKQLQSWLTAAHESQGTYNEKLDQSLRITVIGINARGFEVTLKTTAEERLTSRLSEICNDWSLDALEQCTAHYQHALCQESYHLDRIEQNTSYSVSNISVPIFGANEHPELVFTVGSINKDLMGSDINDIAQRLKESSVRITQAARKAAP